MIQNCNMYSCHYSEVRHENCRAREKKYLLNIVILNPNNLKLCYLNKKKISNCIVELKIFLLY